MGNSPSPKGGGGGLNIEGDEHWGGANNELGIAKYLVLVLF